MYIQPNSTIILLKGVPLDNTYTDTIYFASATAQYNHFSSYTKKTFGNQTYQRVNKEKIRLQVKADDIYDYNYLMFRNTSYGSKWFYAFIKEVNYVNDSTSEIVYEIDVMQTWFFEHQLERSYVEREHTLTDEIGENIIAENIDLGPIKCYDSKIATDAETGDSLFDEYSVAIFRVPGRIGD